MRNEARDRIKLATHRTYCAHGIRTAYPERSGWLDPRNVSHEDAIAAHWKPRGVLRSISAALNNIININPTYTQRLPGMRLALAEMVSRACAAGSASAATLRSA